jgi:hypothetical protein
MNEHIHTGGCQCGTVRYKLTGDLRDPHLCHCRMCQKAFGSFFAPLVGVKCEEIEWIKGAPTTYRSSTLAERGFCSTCGTPLTFRYVAVDRGEVAVSIGSLDEPARVKPQKQYGMEACMPWFSELADLPGSRTEDDMPADILAQLHSNQHPDHD